LALLSAKQRDQFRADHIGVIFQQFNLLSYAKVIDNILLPLHFSKQRSQNVKNPITAAENLCSSTSAPRQNKEHAG
jgi:putative ABC transport system ATP-binding protein